MSAGRAALLVLTVAICLGLAACGGDGEDKGASITSVPSTSAGEATSSVRPTAPGGEDASAGEGSEGSQEEAEGSEQAAEADPVTIEQAEAACETRPPAMGASASVLLDRICDAAEAGDEEALREAVAAACRKFVVGSTPEGSRQRAMGLESCAGNAG